MAITAVRNIKPWGLQSHTSSIAMGCCDLLLASAACCDDVQLTKLMRNPLPTPFTTVNYFIGLRPPNTATCSLFTTVNYFIGLRPPKNRYLYIYLQPSITSSDCVLLQAADVEILGTFTFASIIPSCSFTFASIIPSCSFTFASIIPSCSFTFARVIPTLFSCFFIKTFLLYLFLLLF